MLCFCPYVMTSGLGVVLDNDALLLIKRSSHGTCDHIEACVIKPAKCETRSLENKT